MKIHFFTIPVYDGDADLDELNRCLATHRVTDVCKEFVAAGSQSRWFICVTTVSGQENSPAAKKSRVDYRDVLSADDFAVFADLRTLRKEFAEKDGVPVYAVFTNENLADMVRQRVNSLADMKTIDGIGPARIEKYGAAFVARLCKTSPISAAAHVPQKTTPK